MKTIPSHQIHSRLRTDNPWWEAGKEAPVLEWSLRPRPYLRPFLGLLQDRTLRRAVVLMGPRRVGKTVMIHHAAQALLGEGVDPRRLWYLSVDHPLYNGLDLERLLVLAGEASGIDPGEGEVFAFFDEVQYLKAWEVSLKSLVDRFPSLRLVASGSAAAALRLKSLESGAGRFTDFFLPPLTFYEFLLLQGEEDLVEPVFDGPAITDDMPTVNARFIDYLNFGGYPEALFSPSVQADPARHIKGDIIDKVLLRDLPSLYGIQDIQELNYLFTTLAFNSGGEVSLDQLGKSSGVAKNTIKRYLEYLEAAFLIRILHRIDRGGKRFLRANFFKVYLTNPSMRAALFSAIGPEDVDVGSLVETAILCQWFHREVPLHYARWSNGEVDLVRLGLATRKPAWALEVCWTDRSVQRPRELKSLVDFCHFTGLQKAWLTTRTARGKLVIDSVEIEYFPSSLYAFTVGYNSVQQKAGAPPPLVFSA